MLRGTKCGSIGKNVLPANAPLLYSTAFSAISMTRQAPTKNPVLVSYCSTFLKPEMLHVYRQVSGINNFNHWVVTRRRENATQFPFKQLIQLNKHPLRGFRRLWYRLQDRSIPIGRHETRQLLNLTSSKNAAVLHVYFGTEASRLLPYLCQETCAKVVSFHGADLSENLKEEEFQALLKTTDLFLARSESLVTALQERGCPEERIRLNRTGIPLPEKFEPLQLGAISAEQPLRLLQACRFIPKKGLDITLEAVAMLNTGGMPATLDLAGGGPLQPSLEQQAKELGISDRVRFLGFLPNHELLSRLRNYHLFIHPSRTTDTGDREGIPNSLLEAMAYGIPPVATRHSGIPEAVEDGVNGSLIDQAEPEALSEAIKKMTKSPENYIALSAAAHDRIRWEFSLQACTTALENSYRYAIKQAII